MKEKRLEEKPACSVKSVPFPADIVCPHCEAETEIWSDETRTKCIQCSSLIQNP